MKKDTLRNVVIIGSGTGPSALTHEVMEKLGGVIVIENEGFPCKNYSTPVVPVFIDSVNVETIEPKEPFYKNKGRRGKRKYHGNNKF
jgi:hypothetical protein